MTAQTRGCVPLLVQHVLQEAPAFPTAGPAAVQARALCGQLEGAQAAPRSPAGRGLAHLASQALYLIQAQKPFGPRILPQLLPEGFQAWGEAGEAGSWASVPHAGQRPEAGFATEEAGATWK